MSYCGISYCTAYIVYYWTGFRVLFFSCAEICNKECDEKILKAETSVVKVDHTPSRLPTKLEGERNNQLSLDFFRGGFFYVKWQVNKNEKTTSPNKQVTRLLGDSCTTMIHPGSFCVSTFVRLIQNTAGGGGFLQWPKFDQRLDFCNDSNCKEFEWRVIRPMSKNLGFAGFSSSRTNPWLRSSNHFRRTWWWAVISDQAFFFLRNSKYFPIHLKLGSCIQGSLTDSPTEISQGAAASFSEKQQKKIVAWKRNQHDMMCRCAVGWGLEVWKLLRKSMFVSVLLDSSFLLRKKCCTPKGTGPAAVVLGNPISFALGSGSTDNQPTQYHHTTATNLRSCETARVRPDSIVFGPIRSTRAVQLCKLWQTSY